MSKAKHFHHLYSYNIPNIPPPFDPIEKALIGHSLSVQHQCQQEKMHVIASRQRSKFLGFTKSAFFPGGGGRVGAFLQFHRDATFTAGWVPSGDRFATNEVEDVFSYILKHLWKWKMFPEESALLQNSWSGGCDTLSWSDGCD